MKMSITVFLFGFFWGCQKDQTILRPVYTIGIIDYYSPEKNTANIAFNYFVNNKIIHTSYSSNQNGWYVPIDFTKKYKPGDRYMIQYDSSNYELARFLFDYPVRDSSDYKRYVEQFKTNPPQ